MIFAVWEGVYLALILLCLIGGTARGGLRTMSFFSAHLITCVTALVFTPALGEIIVGRAGFSLNSWFPLFLPFYLLPMILLTQLFRALYKRGRSGSPPGEGFAFRAGGMAMGLLTGVFFCLLLTWLLLLQPWIPEELIYRWGGTFFTHASRLLQVFMRFYV